MASATSMKTLPMYCVASTSLTSPTSPQSKCLRRLLCVAEKAHAYTKVYEGGRRSSRVKDLIDLVLIASLFPFKAEQLRRGLDRTFSVRGTHALPSGLPLPPGDWNVPYRRQAQEVGLAEDISLGYEEASHFLDPILDGSCPNQWSWNPWRESGRQTPRPRGLIHLRWCQTNCDKTGPAAVNSEQRG